MTTRCGSCGTDNPRTSRFCRACGSPLGVRCSACGSPVLREFRFCGNCGAGVERSAAEQPAGSATTGGESPDRRAVSIDRTGVGAATMPIAERRVVSVLFADLVGFTSLAEGRDPEEVQDLLASYFDACRTVIGRYGGTVEKFIGDAVMAMWGAPVAHEDDAERAVRAGVELVAAVATLGRELGLAGLSARAGVVSGEAAVTVGAVGQGMVAGDVVNTASRLQGAARPGTVLVDEATYRTVRGSISFEQAGKRALRGKRLPVPAWEARQVVALRRGEGRSALPEAPLVGRESAVAITRDLLHTVRGERTVRLCSIFGQAGIGKSRIIWELEKYVDGVVEQIFWHQARSPAYGEGLAFWALAEMVRRRAGIAEGDRPAASRRRLSACLSRFVPDQAERRWLAPYLASLVGLGPAPGGDREEAFAAWRAFLERIADVGTTVLVFDDLHWADDGLLDFIEHLGERASGRPILIVTVARPELLERRPDWGAGRRGHVVLSLEPLSRTAMAELLTGLAPGLPTDVAARILDRAEGVPLYAVELLRMLVDRGDLEVVDGVYEVRGRLARLAVPETLHALVAARLDGLDPEDRTLLRDAAVLGQAFRPAALAAIAGTTVEAIEPSLRRLVRRELLVPDPDDRTPGRDRMRFSEWLVREVAYGTLALRDRRTLHLAAAGHYESLDDPELSGTVASHVLAAYRAGPPGRADATLAERAAAALRTAADRASALYAHETALGFLEEALSVTADGAVQARLLEQAAISAQATARLKEAEGYIRRAIDWHQARGDRSAVARTTARLGTILMVGYEADASIAVVRAALDELGDDTALRDDPALVSLLAGLARAYLTHGRTRQAAEWADRALEGAERLDLRPITAEALATKGGALVEDGRTSEGVGLLRASLAMAEEHGLVVPALRARNSLAVGLLVDDPRAALGVARAGLEVARRVGFRDLALRLASNWAEAALEVGEWSAILEILAELDRDDLPLLDRVDFESAAALVLTWRGDPMAAVRFATLEKLLPGTGEDLAVATLRGRQSAAALALGRPLEALEHADAATAGHRPYGLRTAILGGSILAGRAALWAGELRRTGQIIAEIERSGLHGRSLDTIRMTLEAGLAARRGEVATALEHYADAAATWRRLDVPLQLALCQMEAATFLPAGSEEALAEAAEARRTLEGLGAVALLARLDSHHAAPTVTT